MPAFLKEILKKPPSILLLFFILAFLNTTPAFFLLHRGFFIKDSITFSFIIAFSAFLVMFLLPAGIIRFVFKEKLIDFGLSFPKDRQSAVKLTLIAIVILLPILFLLATLTNFQQYYLIKHKIDAFFMLEVIASFIYFFSEEFLFRGVLFFGLWDKFKFHTFWITNLVFALLHLGKPFGEIFVAFFIGNIFSYLSFKTKSILPAVVVHFIIALLLNIIIIFVY